MPFVQFNVRRLVTKGDLGTPEGKQRFLDEVGPFMADVRAASCATSSCGTSATASTCLRARRRPAAPGRPPTSRRGAPPGAVPSRPGAPARPTTASTRGRPRRRGLAQRARAAGRRPADRADRAARARRRARAALPAFCIALPEVGRQALGQIDLDEHLTSPLVRRAAEHLRAHLDAPASGLPEHDPDLTALVRALAVRATQEPASPAALRAQRLHLELRRLERLESNLRAAGHGGIHEVAARKTLVQAEFHEAVEEAPRTERLGGVVRAAHVADHRS
jgi:hypothetical protein